MIITFFIITLCKDKNRLRDWTQENTEQCNISMQFNMI